MVITTLLPRTTTPPTAYHIPRWNHPVPSYSQRKIAEPEPTSKAVPHGSLARRLIVARGTLADHGRSSKERLLFAAAPPSLVLGGREKPRSTPRSDDGNARLAGARGGRPCPQRPALRSLAPDPVPSLAIPPAPGGHPSKPRRIAYKPR